MNWYQRVMKSFFSMRKLNFLLGVVLVAATVLTSCEKEVTGISLDKSTLILKMGEWQTLAATVLPSGATDKSITWISNDPTVATVIDGIVTAIRVGKTTVIAKAGNYTATCEVTVLSGLEGTTWKGKDSYGNQCTLILIDATNCVLDIYSGSFSGTYFLLNYPSISVDIPGLDILSGAILNNTMTLWDGRLYAITLTKQ